LHQAHSDGRARPVLKRNVGANVHDLLVGGTECQVQEAERIEERLGSRAKALSDGLHRDYRGLLALLMSTHAIAGDQECRVVGDLGRDAVLVAFPCASVAEFSMYNAQAGSKWLG
jgi:hypothetical protein